MAKETIQGIMAIIIPFPKLIKTEWYREKKMVTISYHADTNLVVQAPHNRLLHLPFNDVAAMFLMNGWRQEK